MIEMVPSTSTMLGYSTLSVGAVNKWVAIYWLTNSSCVSSAVEFSVQSYCFRLSANALAFLAFDLL